VASELLVVRGAGTVPAWESDLAQAGVIVRAATPHELRASLNGCDAALIDERSVDALDAAQRLHAHAREVQITIVVEETRRAQLERAMLLRQGLGEVWFADPASVDAELVNRAAGVTRQRRSYRATSRRLEHDLAAIEPHAARRAFISDAYLAALLGVLPDPVISLDERGRVISWNEAAVRFFSRDRGSALGMPLTDAIRPTAPESVVRLLADAAPDRPARAELEFETAAGQVCIAESVVVRLRVDGRDVRMIVLHDVTEQRRTQAELESNAAELEAQSEELQHQSAMLEEAQAELEVANHELLSANAALTQRTMEAEEARVEAERANRAKSDFLATMSHEIRTPINAILGYNELLRMELAGPLQPQQRQHLERIHASSQHLLALIEDVLDLAKIEARRVEVEREHALAVNAVAAAVEIVAHQAAENDVTLTSTAVDGGDDAWYFGDERRVQQIVVNLLTNAIKFTDAGGRIDLMYGVAAASPIGDAPMTFIRVTDTGIGIELNDVNRIFRPFEQVQQGHTRRHGGAGLGLAISRELAHLMGGDITVESTVGAGSVFTLWLSRNGPDARAPIDLAEAGAAPYPAGVADVGRALYRRMATITERFTAGVREALPVARSLSDVAVQDHTLTLVADIAQTLIDVTASTGATSLVRDGSEIQRVIADLHGRQRAQCGWTIASLEREMALLYEIIESVVHEECGADDSSEVQPALRIVRRMLDTAEQVSGRHLNGQ
jgi:PAS domain S-box-containing protein